MLMYTLTYACFKHSNFFKVKDLDPKSQPVKAKPEFQKDGTRAAAHTPLTGPGCAQATRYPTTSFLTATILIYAFGAGITAAAGTRLALQWILVKVFTLFSFQSPNEKSISVVISCHYLPVSGLGNLRACCLPWMW
jgi:hypothetical protein